MSFKKGDHLKVNRIGGVYSHHGIYIGGEKVIHFNGEPGEGKSQASVVEDSLSTFSSGGAVEVVDYQNEKFSGEQVVERAKLRLGETGYNLGFNNCEHFARWCKTDCPRSLQVETTLLGSSVGNVGFIGGLGGVGTTMAIAATTATTEDKSKAAKKAACTLGGAATGSVIGGVLGSVAGPAGTMVGKSLGKSIGGAIGANIGENASSQEKKVESDNSSEKPDTSGVGAGAGVVTGLALGGPVGAVVGGILGWWAGKKKK